MAAETPGWSAWSPGAETTERLGEVLGQNLPAGALLALIGDLGAGKTTLTRGLARGLGVSEPVHSPTFTRMRELPGRLLLQHVDAWRGGSEAFLAEGAEWLTGEGLAVIEWADRVAAWLPRPRLELTLSHAGPERRGVLLRLVPAAPEGGPRERALQERLEGVLEAAGRTPGLEGLEIR